MSLHLSRTLHPNHTLVFLVLRNSPTEQYHSPEELKVESAEPPPSHLFPLRPMIISTRSQQLHNSPATPSEQQLTESSIEQYNNINSYLRSLRVMRYGDPEQDERWWEKDGNDELAMDMDDNQDTSEYASINNVLRQAFLARHAHERR
ncbi:hypothetical protein BC943DRAFT_312764 [Umbelopsis sp. AD052]|nr:hypothetical protein BC943DRAFT_312764 [Umbelopsis sp. AD052]